jgi:DNA repair exonuclease SbcCD ATPase subunit
MKNFCRSTFLLIMIVVLWFGLFIQAFPPKVASAAGSSNSTENSGGFIVQADRVEGSMNPVAMAAGNVVMGEGKIYGLTITKKLEKSNPALIIRIKSKGPIPVKNLNGKLMGLPQFSSPCLPSQLGWLCLNDVKMKLSEQTVGSISLPNATIETCFEGQCDAVDSTINGKDPTNKDKENALQSTLPDVTKQLDQLTDLLDQTKGLQDLIGGGTDTLQDLLKKAEDSLGLPGQLESLTNQIGDSYKQLGKNLNQLVSLIGSSDQLLSQITGVLNKDDGAELTKALDDNLQKVKDQAKNLQDKVVALKEIQQRDTHRLNDLKNSMKRLKDSISKNKDQYTGDQFEKILNNLGFSTALDNLAPSMPTTTTPITTDNGDSETGTTNDGNSGSDPTADLKQQLADTIENGNRLAESIQSTLENVNGKMDDMEQLSDSLVGVDLLLGSLLNQEKANQFQADLDDVKGYVNSLAAPVQQLKDSLAKAESLESQLGESQSGIQEWKDTLAQVKSVGTELQDDLKKRLISLPLLNEIQSFINQIDAITEEIDTWNI